MPAMSLYNAYNQYSNQQSQQQPYQPQQYQPQSQNNQPPFNPPSATGSFPPQQTFDQNQVLSAPIPPPTLVPSFLQDISPEDDSAAFESNSIIPISTSMPDTIFSPKPDPPANPFLGESNQLNANLSRNLFVELRIRKFIFELDLFGKLAAEMPANVRGSSAKPPMILVYTGDNKKIYQQIYTSIIKILPENIFSIFHISSKAFADDPWMEESIECIIVTNEENLTEKMQEKLKNCIKKGTKFIGNKIPKANVAVSHRIYVVDENSEVELMYDKNGNVYFVVSSNKIKHSLFYNCDNEKFGAENGTTLMNNAFKVLGFKVNESSYFVPELTPGYFVCNRQGLENGGFVYGHEIGDSPKLHFLQSHSDKIIPSAALLPIKVYSVEHGFPDNIDFDVKTYYSILGTALIGKALLFVPVCETTINISKSLHTAMPNIDGILVVAGCQTHGVGRTGNQWISPKGCAMFTFNYNISLSSFLSKNELFVEYILAVSVCDAIKSFSEFREFPIRIKWPNDIYYKREYKIGGTMVTSTKSETALECIVSGGINVANSKPTVCINDLRPNKCEKQLSVEEVIANVIKNFEDNIYLFDKEGKQSFLQKYYGYWLHKDEEVKIQHSDGDKKETVVIKGLNDCGHLQVESKDSGDIFCVHEDENTFDIMNGLIRCKTCS